VGFRRKIHPLIPLFPGDLHHAYQASFSLVLAAVHACMCVCVLFCVSGRAAPPPLNAGVSDDGRAYPYLVPHRRQFITCRFCSDAEPDVPEWQRPKFPSCTHVLLFKFVFV